MSAGTELEPVVQEDSGRGLADSGTSTDIDLAHELDALEAMSRELDDYLADAGISRMVRLKAPHDGRLHTLTLAGLLARADALAAAGAPEDRILSLRSAVRAAARRHPDRLETKLRRELRGNLGNRRALLDDLESRDIGYEEFRSQDRYRPLIDALVDLADALDIDIGSLKLQAEALVTRRERLKSALG